jgi:ubiquinone/menaquinone biosynthesis C-methylase UbiE
VVGLDRHPVTLALAARRGVAGFMPVLGDALRLPFADGSFDYVMSSMFLHHLDEADAVRAMAEMKRVARRGVIIADLLRTRRALVWITLLTMFSTPMVRHDARASVRQAFTRAEIERLCDAAGLGGLRFYKHFGHRFVLAGEV